MNNFEFQADFRYHVKLDGRKIGVIRQCKSGWSYLPKGSSQKFRGDYFPTFALCRDDVIGETATG